MPLQELKRIAESVGERHGWDFSRVRFEREQVPWTYAQVVRRYLYPSCHVLDVGTGGGERFMELAPYFGTGVGVDADPAMIEAALQNRPPALADKIQYAVMYAEALQFPRATFDVVLNRHSVVNAPQVASVLRPGGVFITQQVGAKNTANICQTFGCGPGGRYQRDPEQDLDTMALFFWQAGCAVIGRAEYNVRYYFQDVESLIFWLKALPLPEDFDIERHWPQVDAILAAYTTPRGIQTNEHRELLIVQKREGEA